MPCRTDGYGDCTEDIARQATYEAEIKKLTDYLIEFYELVKTLKLPNGTVEDNMSNGLRGWLKNHKESEKKKKEEAHKKLRDLAKKLGYEVLPFLDLN